MGQTANQTTAQAGTQNTLNANNFATSGAAAQAAGTVGSANAINNGLNNAAGWNYLNGAGSSNGGNYWKGTAPGWTGSYRTITPSGGDTSGGGIGTDGYIG